MSVQKSDLEAKLREIQQVIDETTGAARESAVGIAVGVVLLVLLAFLLGRRRGKRGSARVEVYRVR
jgi:LPXTG-motif cell wall-anchored protein